jgi:hypothetical protein
MGEESSGRLEMNPAKQKIEEAIEYLDGKIYCILPEVEATRLLNEALALIPDWIPFDAERKETWPANDNTEYEVTIIGRAHPDENEDRHTSRLWWLKDHWHCSFLVFAYRPLPEAYQEAK